MGRAMMGTGEASGENRALAAAEAAIANPLLDETSMRGARGLLISITGGRDLTLFEVDEAANRIREEVDADANVIFGAIDDESLEGVIRVSVVATGIDRANVEGAETDGQGSQMPNPVRKLENSAAPQNGPKAQLSEPKAQPMVEVMEALELEMNRPVEEPFRPQSEIFKTPMSNGGVIPQRANPQIQASSTVHAQPQQMPQTPRMQAPRMAQQQTNAPVNMEATARVLDEMTELPSMREKQAAPQPRQAPVRMPELRDFPTVAREKANAAAHRQPAQQGPRSLWQKLTQSLIHRDEEPTARLEPARKQTREPVMPAPENRRQLSSDAAVYAPRHQQPAEPQMRPQQQQRQPVNEEEQLEIPAFLRRQAN